MPRLILCLDLPKLLLEMRQLRSVVGENLLVRTFHLAVSYLLDLFYDLLVNDGAICRFALASFLHLFS
jgi:hypothetical protein